MTNKNNMENLDLLIGFIIGLYNSIIVIIMNEVK